MITNRWRRWTYTLWAPFYDVFAVGFRRYRARSIGLLAPKMNQRVLLVGAGTGLDLPYLSGDLRITAIDLTPAMVTRLHKRAVQMGRDVDARAMDAQHMDLPSASFDAVVLHLILAVVPDPLACIREVERVLRPGGRAVIFDKFASDEGPVRLLRRAANPIASLIASDLTRQLRPILAAAPWLSVVHDERAGLGGFFRIVLVEKLLAPNPTPG